MSGRSRFAVLLLLIGAVATGALLVAFASGACPTDLPGQPCPEAGRNQVIAIVLAAAAAGLLVAPVAYVLEVTVRRGIAYRGAWLRAARRGLLAGGVVAALGGLRVAGALSVPGAIFVFVLAGAIEWLAARLLDGE